MTKRFCWCSLVVSERCFLKEALKMADKVNIFNKAGNALRGAGYRRGMANVQAFDLTRAFGSRGIDFTNMESFPDQNEK